MALTLASVVLATRADSFHGTLAPVPFGSSYSVQSSFLPGRVCVSSSVSASFLWPRPFALFNAPQTGSDRCRGRTGRELRNMIYTMGTPKASSMQMPSTDGGDGDSDIFEGQQIQNSSRGNSFLAKLAVAIGIAAAMTVASIYFMGSKPGMPFGTSFGFEASSSSVSPASSGFTLTFFGYKVVLPEYTPGWLYFWLLMAAGCGLFISEEALNVWVGISLSRTLYLDGTLKSFMHSFSNNAPYIISTVLWVYWGVCISDMIPFYLGRLFRQTKTCNDICSKLGIGKDKVISISRAVQKYDNMIGFVERFSVGVRNPTSFLAGAWGISPECFFAGVCCGGLITLPIQLGTGFLLRERPIMALTGIASAVGLWTVLPYIIAVSAAFFVYLRRDLSNQ